MRKPGKPKQRQAKPTWSLNSTGQNHPKLRADYYWEKCSKPTETFRITGRYSSDNGMRSYVYCIGLETNTIYRRDKVDGWYRKSFSIGPKFTDCTYDSKVAHQYTLSLNQNLRTPTDADC